MWGCGERNAWEKWERRGGVGGKRLEAWGEINKVILIFE